MTIRRDATWLNGAGAAGLVIESSADGTRMRLVLVRGDQIEPLGELTAPAAMELASMCLLASTFLDQAYTERALRKIAAELDAYRQLDRLSADALQH